MDSTQDSTMLASDVASAIPYTQDVTFSGLDSDMLFSQDHISSTLKREADEPIEESLLDWPDAPRPAKRRRFAQTGLVYDHRMRMHVEANPTANAIHPEDPRRIAEIFQALVDADLAWSRSAGPPDPELETGAYMGRIEARPVTEEEVCLVHTKEHHDFVQSLQYRTPGELEVLTQYPGVNLDSIYLSRGTSNAAALSAGGAIELCRAVMNGSVKNGFAIVRPPGHHAEREDCKGFCFYDNVSIATKVCQREFGDACKKVMILDWDVHHGNGIQQANYDNPDVLYISLHVYRNDNFYPSSSFKDGRKQYADHLHCGEGAGLGRNINVPWSKHGMGDADYIRAFQQVIMPAAYEFDPDLVIVASGFDAAEGDMLGGCHVTPAGYSQMTHMLMSLAEGRVAVCLEGGYNLASIANSSVAVAQTLMGEAPRRLTNTIPSVSGIEDINKVLREQSKYWQCLWPKNISSTVVEVAGVRVHDMIREYQAGQLWDKHRMHRLYVPSEELSKQVLATIDYCEAKPMLIILHEPPEMLATYHPLTGGLDQANTFLQDPIQSYIDTAVENGFSVIDVNLPANHAEEPEVKMVVDEQSQPILDESGQHIVSNDTGNYKDPTPVKDQVPEVSKLFSYVFNNYVEPSEATDVFVLGTEAGHAAITNFIKDHEGDNAFDRIKYTFHFVRDISLQTVRSSIGDNSSLTTDYYNTSLVFVSADHNFWNTEFARKPKKKFGDLQKSEQRTMVSMLHQHKAQCFVEMLEVTKAWRASRALRHEELPVSPTKLPPISNFTLMSSPLINVIFVLVN